MPAILTKADRVDGMCAKVEGLRDTLSLPMPDAEICLLYTSDAADE